MRRGIFHILSVALLFFLSCNTPENYEGEPNIYAILSTDLDSAVLMIGKTASIDDTLEIDTILDTIWDGDTFYLHPDFTVLWNGVSGAQVSLEHSGTTYKTRESSVSRGYYVTDTGLSFEPGSLWKLTAKYPDGKTIKAETRIPRAFDIVSPLTDSVTDEDFLVWSTSEGAVAYSLEGMAWGWRREWEWIPEVDSYICILIYDSVPFYENYRYASEANGYNLEGLSSIYICDSLEVCVKALDVNAFDYILYGYRFWEPDSIKEKYLHIENAWGVFGSKTVTETRRYIFKNDTLTDSISPPKRRPHP